MVRSTNSKAEDRCPWCEQVIPHARFDEIKNRIAASEQARTAQIERRLERIHEQHLSEAKAAAEAKVATAQSAARAQVSELRGELRKAENAQVAAESQVAAVRAEAKAAMTAAKQETASKVAAARMTERERADAEHRDKLTEAVNARTAAEQLLATQRAESEKQIEAMKAEAEQVMNTRLLEQHSAMDLDKDRAVRAEQAKGAAERQRMQKTIDQLQRQVQKSTAHDLGEGAEVELYDELKRWFPNDVIERLPKGKQGADIIHKIIENRRQCGCIVYDSKNRGVWRNSYVTVLRRDQRAAKAEQAILVSRAFPAGSAQLDLRDDVIIVNPARAVKVAQLIRQYLVALSRSKVSSDAREQKKQRLYELITSKQFTQQLGEISAKAEQSLDLDVKEQKAHEVTWRQRGEIARTIQQIDGEMWAQIEAIISAPVRPLKHAT